MDRDGVVGSCFGLFYAVLRGYRDFWEKYWKLDWDGRRFLWMVHISCAGLLRYMTAPFGLL